MWWQSLLVAIFGVVAAALLTGGFILGMIYSIRGFTSKAYQIFAISVALGIPSIGISMALVFQELWIIPFSVAAALFMAFPLWLESRFVEWPIEKQAKLTLYLMLGAFLLVALGALLCRLTL